MVVKYAHKQGVPITFIKGQYRLVRSWFHVKILRLDNNRIDIFNHRYTSVYAVVNCDVIVKSTLLRVACCYKP